MRIDRFLLFVLLLASSYGCSEEQPYEVEKESVSIWEGDTRHVIIETDLTEHNYKLESENQEIATATLDEMGVCIATYKSGSTMIRLIDTDNNKIVCEIYVYVIYFNSSEIINWGIPLEVIAWRDVYAFLEYCADCCENVADVVDSIVMKNS